MKIIEYDYVKPQKAKGKIILTCFPGRDGETTSFKESILLNDLKNFYKYNCSIIVSLIEDSEFNNFYDKKKFVRHVYSNNLKWLHMPIVDLNAPDHKFIDKWHETKVFLKNDLVAGKNIVMHCMGGKGRSGTIAAILLIELGENNRKAIEVVREKRKGAIETKEQEDFILSYKIFN